MQVVLPAVKRATAAEVAAELERGGPRAAARFFCFWVPAGFGPALAQLFARGREKHGDYFHIMLGTPKRPHTRRQNNGVFAWCGDIAEQLLQGGQYEGYSFDEVKDRVYQAMKRLAVQEAGWPTRISPIDGSLEPESQALASIEQDNALISIVKRFADENGMWLNEIVDGELRRCLGGVPLEEK